MKTILMAEDYEPDIRIMQEAIKSLDTDTELYVVRNGEQAIDFLSNKHVYKNSPTPDVLLLDLHMPKVDGWEVLRVVRGSAKFYCMPVIVFTSQQKPEVVSRAYSMGATAFIPKPSCDMQEFKSIIRAIDAFWFKLVTFK